MGSHSRAEDGVFSFGGQEGDSDPIAEESPSLTEEEGGEEPVDKGFFDLELEEITVPAYKEEELVEANSFSLPEEENSNHPEEDLILPLSAIEKAMDVDLESPSDKPLTQEEVVEDLYKFDSEDSQEGLFTFSEADKEPGETE